MSGKLIRECYRFCTLRILFPFQYRLHSRKRINEKKAVFIESQLPQLSDSMMLVYQRLCQEKGWTVSTFCLRESFVSKKTFIRMALECLKEIGDAKYIFLCDANRMISCIPKRKETVVTQLWHGCGAFKKFGMSTADLLFGGNRKEYERYPYYGNLDIVTVSSPEVIWAYEEAMNLKGDPCQIQPIGVSRTDVFFQEEFLKKAKERCIAAVEECRNKKVILYAPTFRGNVSEAKAPDALEISAMAEELRKEYVLLIKHHPVVKDLPEIPEEARDFAFDVTGKLSIEDLLCISDICISDYSSLVFEYSLFEKPMIFFAYDLEDHDDWRGFYYDYQELTPGPVYRTTEEIIHYIKTVTEEFDREAVHRFKERFMSSCDGHVTERLISLLSERR